MLKPVQRPTPLWRRQLWKNVTENKALGHTITIGDEHRLHVAVCPLPVQDNR